MENLIPGIKDIINSSFSVKRNILNDNVLLDNIQKITRCIIKCYQNGGKVLLCGNGGSAADAQHIAAELSGKFYKIRSPLYAEALHVNTSYLTAVANDFGYEEIFSRQLEATGKKGDILIAISTSGNSPNIINVLKKANELKLITVGFGNLTGGKMAPLCKYLISVPSLDTPRIQEAHILIAHVICEIVERSLFP